MKIVIACDSFKGSVSAIQVADSLAKGLRRVWPDAEIDCMPVADGGEGTVDAFLYGMPGRKVTISAAGPLGEAIQASFALLDNGTAVIETAAASGLPLLAPQQRDPLRATTYGTGQLICAALDAGCKRIVLGLGGSATNDGGAGMAQALGARFLDAAGQPLPPGGGALDRLERIDLSGLDPRLQTTPVVAACDVTNPLCGPQGASVVYGPQKGATPPMVQQLDRCLRRFAQVGFSCTGRDVAHVPGAGAAGGLGAGLLLFCRAQLCSGIDTMLDVLDFDRRAADADLVFTGEGRIDGQSVCGKVPVGVARRVKAQRQIPVIAVVGGIGPDAERVYDCGIDAVFATAPGPITLQHAMRDSQSLLCRTAEQIARLILSIHAGG